MGFTSAIMYNSYAHNIITKTSLNYVNTNSHINQDNILIGMLIMSSPQNKKWILEQSRYIYTKKGSLTTSDKKNIAIIITWICNLGHHIDHMRYDNEMSNDRIKSKMINSVTIKFLIKTLSQLNSGQDNDVSVKQEVEKIINLSLDLIHMTGSHTETANLKSDKLGGDRPPNYCFNFRKYSLKDGFKNFFESVYHNKDFNETTKNITRIFLEKITFENTILTKMNHQLIVLEKMVYTKKMFLNLMDNVLDINGENIDIC